MKRPVARPIGAAPSPATEPAGAQDHAPPVISGDTQPAANALEATDSPLRAPRAFAPSVAQNVPETIQSFVETKPDDGDEIDAVPIMPRRKSRLGAIAWAAFGVLVAAALGLAADELIRNLLAQHPVLGYAGIAVLVVLLVTLAIIAVREYLALRRLRVLDQLRQFAAGTLLTDRRDDGREVLAKLNVLYLPRPDLAPHLTRLTADSRDMLDGADMVQLAERTLMGPLDARARVLTAAAARRVALVTAMSPRAAVDLAFVAWECIRLGGAIARLYGSRPGVFGSFRLAGEVLGHLAITGGLALTDGIVGQVLGHGLAAKISARLGEGLVNGLMTVRVGIAAMAVTRPLPFDVIKQPMVRDFAGDLANLTAKPVDE